MPPDRRGRGASPRWRARPDRLRSATTDLRGRGAHLADSTLGLSVPESARFVRRTVDGAHGAVRVEGWVLDTSLKGPAAEGQRLELQVVVAPAEVDYTPAEPGVQRRSTGR